MDDNKVQDHHNGNTFNNPGENDMTPLVQTEECQLIHIIHITGYAYLLILSSQTLPHIINPVNNIKNNKS